MQCPKCEVKSVDWKYCPVCGTYIGKPAEVEPGYYKLISRGSFEGEKLIGLRKNSEWRVLWDDGKFIPSSDEDFFDYNAGKGYQVVEKIEW